MTLKQLLETMAYRSGHWNKIDFQHEAQTALQMLQERDAELLQARADALEFADRIDRLLKGNG